MGAKKKTTKLPNKSGKTKAVKPPFQWLDQFALFDDYCKIQHCWMLMIYANGENIDKDELLLAAPWLQKDPSALLDVWIGCTVFVRFRTEAEARGAFDQTVGACATRINGYNGPASVYACLAGPDGIILDNV